MKSTCLTVCTSFLILEMKNIIIILIILEIIFIICLFLNDIYNLKLSLGSILMVISLILVLKKIKNKK